MHYFSVLIELASGTSPFDGITSLIELKVTIDETTIEDLIPSSIYGRFRELLKFSFKKSPEQRLPAKVLLKSPWFRECGIESLNDAVTIMKSFVS